jgi:hypothetical protein
MLNSRSTHLTINLVTGDAIVLAMVMLRGFTSHKLLGSAGWPFGCMAARYSAGRSDHPGICGCIRGDSRFSLADMAGDFSGGLAQEEDNPWMK